MSIKMYYQVTMGFPERLVQELEHKGWSRSEAARRGGISASMFDKVINGYSQPGIKFLKGIARAFDKSLPEILSWMDAPKDDDAENITLAEWYLGNFKYPETKARALAYLEFLRTEEDKGDYLAKHTQNATPSESG
jgi:transcriptional regulator with XRE-family HTH domain